jgi:hypothetical protein
MGIRTATTLVSPIIIIPPVLHVWIKLCDLCGSNCVICVDQTVICVISVTDSIDAQDSLVSLVTQFGVCTLVRALLSVPPRLVLMPI